MTNIPMHHCCKITRPNANNDTPNAYWFSTYWNYSRFKQFVLTRRPQFIIRGNWNTKCEHIFLAIAYVCRTNCNKLCVIWHNISWLCRPMRMLHSCCRSSFFLLRKRVKCWPERRMLFFFYFVRHPQLSHSHNNVFSWDNSWIIYQNCMVDCVKCENRHHFSTLDENGNGRDESKTHILKGKLITVRPSIQSDTRNI